MTSLLFDKETALNLKIKTQYTENVVNNCKNVKENNAKQNAKGNTVERWRCFESFMLFSWKDEHGSINYAEADA